MQWLEEWPGLCVLSCVFFVLGRLIEKVVQTRRGPAQLWAPAMPDAMANYFLSLVTRESSRTGKPTIGVFDEGGHFLTRPFDPAYDPTQGDDLENTWEPPA